jgi:hypothetical protein
MFRVSNAFSNLLEFAELLTFGDGVDGWPSLFPELRRCSFPEGLLLLITALIVTFPLVAFLFKQ